MGFFGKVRDKVEVEKAKARSKARQREVERQEREAQEKLQLDLDAKAARKELKDLKKQDKDRKAVEGLKAYKEKRQPDALKKPKKSQISADFDDFLGEGPGSSKKKKKDVDEFDPFQF